MVEAWIEGTELAVSVLGEGEDALVLPAVEIVPTGALYDFDARMTPGAADFFAPARITPAAEKAASDVACAVHNALGCRDVSRVDMILDAEGNPFVLECNSSPGMTETSLLPMAAEAADMTFQDVVSRLIEAALSRGDSGK
jgi:D-alanine-D-alanine ligase